MRMKKESALDRLGLLSAANRFYKDERGILFFRDADWTECLCVPRSQVPTLLKETHDRAFETAHAGPARMYLQLKAHVRMVTPPPSSTSIYLCLFIFVGLYS